ncbi:MAG: hypothetical protein L0Z49_07165 [Actinobacteria bacterium]|nr:hypothetical protein [Actinomycetota bacterium]
MIDASDVADYARHLDIAAVRVEVEAELWASEWGEHLTEAMIGRAPERTGALKRAIRQVEPGGIAIGVDYWPFVDRGTARQAPQPFIAPAFATVRRPAQADAGRRALRLLRR